MVLIYSHVNANKNNQSAVTGPGAMLQKHSYKKGLAFGELFVF